MVLGSGQVRYVVNGQVRIAFEDLGGTGGDPLLLIMGLAASRFWWPDALVGEFIPEGRILMRGGRINRVPSG